MNHLASPKFWQAFKKLPDSIQELSNKNFELLKQNPRHPSLQFKKVGKFWSVRVGLKYRALAIEHTDDLIWFWIGTHADYDKFLKKRTR